MRDKAEDPTADLVDAQIVAGMLRLKYRNAVSTYQRRYPDMPRPVVDPGPGRPKLWHRTEIEKWMMRTSRDRQPRVHDRDPHYADILKGLGSHLDPAVFEDCIVDILKPEIPVAPVRGGHDGGMDGAVFDGEGVPFPLVVTTAEDVIGNLQTSLASYIKSGGKRRKAVIATSRDLTARRRRNLEDKASELGFVLVQTFDRRGVADRLYGESRWCKLLLGLTGKPPVFSQFPPSPRPLQGGQLIGRTEQTAFLTLGEGDQLLLGSPGSGKTAILADFAATTGALFVHSDDATSIANGIRDQKPSIIIVDDAQIHLGAIEELVRRRRQFGLSYRIVVSSWPNEKDLIVDMLNLDRSAVITALELTRDQIVEVIKTTDITGPNRLIAEIVEQARGLPGLAITLSRACLAGNVQDVTEGDVISREIRNTLSLQDLPHATSILAALGVSGERGMRLEDAAQGLGLSPSEVRREMTELAPAGVIRPSHHERWVVYPSALRYALVRDVFFSTEPNLLPGPFIEGVTADRTLDGEVNDHDLQQLMELIPDVLEENRPHREVARTLIGTKRVGGRVPPQLLIRHLRDSKSNRAWAEWAGLGAYEARHALRERPTAILEHPEPFLYWITHEALANLLDAVSDRQSAPMHTGKRPPLEVVTNWIRRKWQPDEALHRRKMATAVAIEWGEAHPASDLDCQILGTVLSPGYECSTLDPGAGDTLTINSGILQDSVLQEIGALWSDSILPFLKTRPANNLRPVVRAVSSWKNLSHASLASPSSEKAKAAQTLATPMIADLLELTSGHPGLWHKIAKLAEDMGIEPGAPDWEYMLMYGPLDRSDVEGWEAADADRAEKARQLGKSRADSNPSTVTSKLASLEKSAKEAGDGWPRYTPQYAEALAEHSNTDPLEWVREFESASLPPDLVQPFLSQAHEPGTSRIWATIRNLIEKPQYEWLAIHTTITAIDAPSDLQKEALDRMVPYTKQLEWTVLRGELHPNTIRRLLQHEDDSVASTVAIEMWSRKHETPSDPEIASLWREGILRTPEDQGHEYNLGGILASDQDLAVEWLSSRLGTSSSSFLIERSPTTAAIDSLDEKSRVRLLSHLQTRYWAGEITAKIVGNSPAVYRALLEDESLKDLHLAPVAGHSKKDRMGLDDHWAARVKMALEHGYTSEQIADATFPISYVWSGSESQMWESWIEAFQTIPSDTPDVEMIKAIGISTAQERKQDALAGEHKRQVYGYTYAG